MRASELTVTNWKPLPMRPSAASGAPLWMPATTLCALARARMCSTAWAAFGSSSSNAGLQPSEIDRSDGTDVDRVEPLDRQDGVEVVERLRGLDHREA